MVFLIDIHLLTLSKKESLYLKPLYKMTNINFKQSLVLIVFLLLSGHIFSQSITGLNGWKIFIDPGHSQKENMGLYNYSEAEKVLRVALALQNMFLAQTDISNVYLSRLTDSDLISLEGRTTLANTLGPDFYYSIHSDAGGPASNSTLMLYGGWRSNGMTIEKTPIGGAAYGAILNDDLSGAMRIPTRGNFADRNFYLGVVDNHENKWPYLHVNRTTNMTSLLSEAGFHTNPRQQQLNMNAQWKELEALSAFRSFLEFHGINRPAIGVATGIITDEDTGLPLNGINVKIGEKEYNTDSYESLFNKYSTNPKELANGFYWISGLNPGSDVEVVFSSPFFQTKSQNLSIITNPNGRTHQNLSFLDVKLTSVVPAIVESVTSEKGLSSVKPSTPVFVKFSRKMDKGTIESAISINQAASLTYSWSDDFTLAINTSQLAFLTNYSVIIDGSIGKNLLTGQFLDGDKDGNEGGNYTFEFTTSPEDTNPPVIIDNSPVNSEVVSVIRPVIRLVFNEIISAASIGVDAIKLKLHDGNYISGEVSHAVVNGKSVIHFFPATDLVDNNSYNIEIAAGLKDEWGNGTDSQIITFSVKENRIETLTNIDKFDAITNWWQPQASGSTVGIVTEQTSQGLNTTFLNKTVSTTGSLRLSYGWNISHGAPYIRLYIAPAAAQNANKFNKSHVLQVYMFGDGSNNQFRFMIRDGLGTLETTQWVSINWIGWKLVSWNLSSDPVFGWVNGNGILDGTNFYMDGFHFRYVAGANQAGTLYFEDLRFVTLLGETPTHINEETKNDVVIYPNPAREIINLNSTSSIQEIRVINLSGNLVKLIKPGSDKAVVNVSDFQPGLYIFNVLSDNKWNNYKVIVER